MGYPASAALLFKALTEDHDKWLHNEAQNILKNFSLFSIILADPVKDPVFYQHLQDNFSFYDRLTGQKFMFFSIVKQADSGAFHGAHKQFKIFNDVEAYKQDYAAEETKHSELAIHALCAILGINYDETPCLIISNNLQFGQFCKVETNVKQLEKQLICLRNVADYLPSNARLSSLVSLLAKFNESSKCFDEIETLEIDNYVIKFVAKILQVISNESIFSDKTLKALRYRTVPEGLLSPNLKISGRINEALSLLNGINKMHYYNEPLKYSLSPSVCVENESNATNLTPIEKEKSVTTKLHNEWHNVQASTKNHLECAAYMEKNMMHLFDRSGDYTSISFPLCKSFETEITYSAVQFIRKQLGVNMPTYFSKYCPSLNNLPITPLASLINNPREIFFNNKKNDGKWIPPGLGESRLGFATLKSITNNFGDEWLPSEKSDLLLKQWEIIQKVRNKSAHMEQVTRKDKDRLDEGLNELHTANLLNALTSLKRSLNH